MKVLLLICIVLITAANAHQEFEDEETKRLKEEEAQIAANETEKSKKDKPKMAISAFMDQNNFTRWINSMILEGGLENFLLSAFIIYGVNYMMGM